MTTNKNSKPVAIALINKLIKYEQSIDKKSAPSAAELRHVKMLRTIIKNSR
jgi:hypothetical protein